MSNMAVQVEKSVIWEIERLEYSNTVFSSNKSLAFVSNLLMLSNLLSKKMFAKVQNAICKLFLRTESSGRSHRNNHDRESRLPWRK